MKNSIPKILRLGFILGLLVLVISASIPYYNFTMMRDSERWVDHTMQVLQTADSLRIAVVDAETGQRGYLLTQNPLYLQPFIDSQKKIGEELNLLKALTADNPAQQKYMVEIDVVTQQKLDLLQTTVQLERQNKHDEAMQIVHTDEGRRLMGEIRRLLGEFKQAEKQLLENRVNEVNADAKRTLYSFLIISCINFLLFSALYFLILKNARQRHLAEAALKHQTQLLGSVINNMSEGLYVIDTAGKPLLHNPVMEEIYDKKVAQIKLDEWQNQYKISMIDGSDFAFAQFPMVRVLNGEFESDAEIIVNPAGSTQPKIIRVNARRLVNELGALAGVVCIFSDISQQKKGELKLRLAMQQAELASKAKSDFVANMSHEIRTPLNAIMGTAQILQKTELSTLQNKYVSMVVLSAQSLLAVLNDILDFSKIEAGKMELVSAPFYLSDVMQQLAAIMSMAAEKKNIELIIDIDNAIPRMFIGDANRLHQILVNFISNAIKFTETGEVTVSVTSDDSRADQVLLRFSVIDTGIGISQEQQERLFSPFIQADSSITRKFGGTGLGLTISRRLAELMGGLISMSSVVGKGSEFTATIPFKTSNEVKHTEYTSATEKKRHLLVVDDNESVRNSIANIISHWQWSADIVASVEEGVAALRKVQADNFSYDAILLDRQITGIDAADPLSVMRAIVGDKYPIIVMTNLYRRETFSENEIAQPDGIIFKPITSSTLFDSLNELLNQNTSVEKAAIKTAANDILLGIRILLVEDNEFNQIVARDLLMQFGAVVDIVDNGQKAVDTLQHRLYLYDIILMDVQMPVMDGFSATKILRQEMKVTLPIIAMTAGVTEFERNLCIQSGMNDLIAKPIEAEKMVAVIAQHTTGAQYQISEQHQNVATNAEGIFDIRNLLNIGANNPAHVEKMISVVTNLVKNTEANFASAKHDFALGRYEVVASFLHSLRGNLGVIGAKRLVENAWIVEQLISEQESVSTLETAFHKVEVELQKTLAAAKKWIQKSAVQ